MPEKKRSRLPRTAYEQFAQLPSEPELEEVTFRLHQQIVDVLTTNRVNIIGLASRTKTMERRMAKLERRGWDFPLYDIHAARLILANDDVHPAAELILKEWPSPKVYPWGMPSYRDYSDPQMKARFNRASLPDYKAVHLTIRINEGSKLAEVQLMTPEQFQVAEQNRGEYLRAQEILRLGSF